MKLNFKHILIIVALTIVIGGLFWYLSNQEETLDEQTMLFFSASTDNRVFAIYYDVDNREIVKKRILDTGDVMLTPSSFNSHGANDSVQYNRISDKILLAVTNISDYDGSFLSDAPYTSAIWITSFKDEAPEIVYSTDNRIMSWITHPYLPLIYITHEYGESYNDVKQEILEVDITNGKVRKVTDLKSIYYLDLAISEDGNYLYTSTELDSRKILLERINTKTGEVIEMDINGESASFNSCQIAPNEKLFAYFGGWLAQGGLHVAHLENGTDEVLPLPLNIDISNFNIVWSGDSRNLLFEIKEAGNYVPFIYSIEDKEGRVISELTDDYPIAWAPSNRYILLKGKAYASNSGFNLDLFDLENNISENIFSTSSFVGIKGVKIYED